MALTKDEKYMKMCFKLAKKGGLNVLPNPLVGCVIVKDNKIISSGYHKKYGEFHAERNAILKAKDEDLIGATLYVNLEPCSHFGKTPPCSDLIIEKKIKRVVYSNKDLNSKVNGKKALLDAKVEITEGVLEDEGRKLNKVFFKHIVEKTPYVMLKTAATLDSKIATSHYKSKWVTGDEARKKVMELRNSYQAILTGSNTVEIDNPRLTARIKNGINPTRIIMDRKGKLDFNLNVFQNDGTRIIVIDNSDKIYPSYIEKIPFQDFKSLFKTLYKMGIYSIMVEAGGLINSLLLKENLIDEINHFIAPKILGDGISFVSGFSPVEMSDCIDVEDMKIEKFGQDILLNYTIRKKDK